MVDFFFTYGSVFYKVLTLEVLATIFAVFAEMSQVNFHDNFFIYSTIININ